MRLHVVSLPHTQVTAQFSSCAFTQKVLRFCQMMRQMNGHHVTLYAGERAEVAVDELVTCIDEAGRRDMLGDRHYTAVDWHHPTWALFNRAVIAAMATRLQPHDFICLIGGTSHQPIANAFPEHMAVEFGIGYEGSFAKFRVFESYAWMHAVAAWQAGAPSAADIRWFDAVIPNQVDIGIFHRTAKRTKGYYLYAGRDTARKGLHIAQEVCQRLGKPLLVAGPGEHRGYGTMVGATNPQRLADLMRGAVALFAPTVYMEPFGTVAIEAMACGTPVIATDYGAFTETVIPGVTGFRCRTLAEFMDAARIAPTLNRKTIGEIAHARYSMQAVAEAYETYFRRLETLWGDGWYALKEEDGHGSARAA